MLSMDLSSTSQVLDVRPVRAPVVCQAFGWLNAIVAVTPLTDAADDSGF